MQLHERYFPVAEYGLPKGWDFLEAYDREFVTMCKELWVLCLPGWQESEGVQAEIGIASEQGKRIHYYVTPMGGRGMSFEPLWEELRRFRDAQEIASDPEREMHASSNLIFVARRSRVADIAEAALAVCQCRSDVIDINLQIMGALLKKDEKGEAKLEAEKLQAVARYDTAINVLDKLNAEIGGTDDRQEDPEAD